MKTIEAQFYENFKNEQNKYQDEYEKSINELEEINNEEYSCFQIVSPILLSYDSRHHLVKFY